MADPLSDPLRTLPPALTTPPTSLPPIFSTLATVDPNSEEFLPTLGLFLQNKGEHKLLEQLEGSAAVYVADILDKVRNYWAAESRETLADLRVVFGCGSAFLPSKILQKHPLPPAVTMWVVGGVAHLLHVSTRGSIFEPTAVDRVAFFRSVQGDVGWGSGRCEGTQGSSVQRPGQIEKGKRHLSLVDLHTLHASELSTI